ncbi:MAG: cobalt ECF transporter T component CbiQ [Pseudomonadota bacterium]
MHHHYFDRLAYASSPVHRLDPRVKLSLALLAILVGTGVGDDGLWRLLPLAGGTLLCALWARLPLVGLLRRSLLVVPFVLAVAVLLPFQGEGAVAWSLQVGGFELALRETGLHRLGTVAARSYLAIWVVLVLVSTTRFHLLLAALRSLGMPRLLVMVLGFLYRYLFVVTGEALRMRRAREARAVGRSRLRLRLGAAGSTIGLLFVRAYERAERVYQAMLARGFDGELPLPQPLHLHGRDWMALGLGLAGLLVVLLLPLSRWPS